MGAQTPHHQPAPVRSSVFDGSYTLLLKLLAASIVLGVAYCLYCYVAFIGDWSDSTFIADSRLLLQAIGDAGMQAGIASGLYIALQVWLVRKYTARLPRAWQILFVLLALVVTITTVATIPHAASKDMYEQSFDTLQQNGLQQ